MAKPKTMTRKEAPRRFRPALEREQTAKAGVVLTVRQLGALDRLVLDLQDAGAGRGFARSDIIRGILQGVLESGIDLTGAGAVSESEISDVIAARLRR